MRLQHETILNKDEEDEANAQQQPRCAYAIITVAAGNGVKELFESLGAKYVISGGQTMNPSTEDVINAIKEVNADQVIILPNNKNIFMAAKQAAEVVEIPVEVVPSKTISQGMTAMLAFNERQSLKENKDAMVQMLDTVVSGSITHAIRDSSIEGINIKKDDFLGMVDGKIVVSEADMLTSAKETLKQMVTEDAEIITIIIGEDGSQKDAKKLEEAVLAVDSELEVEIHEGNQPVYPYLFSAE